MNGTQTVDFYSEMNYTIHEQFDYELFNIKQRDVANMDKPTNDDFLKSMFKLKSLLTAGFQMKADKDCNVNMQELILMKGISENTDWQNNVTLSEIRKYLALSKATISQMLGSLERKGYIKREIDKSNRRNIIATLTPEGRELLAYKNIEYSQKLDRIVSYLGAEDTQTFIFLVGRLVEVMEGEFNLKSDIDD